MKPYRNINIIRIFSLQKLHINTRFVLGWDHKPQIAEIDFSLVLCFERFFWKNQQIFPLLLVKLFFFSQGRRCRL